MDMFRNLPWDVSYTRQRGGTIQTEKKATRLSRNLDSKSQLPAASDHQMLCWHWVVFFMGAWRSRSNPSWPCPCPCGISAMLGCDLEAGKEAFGGALQPQLWQDLSCLSTSRYFALGLGPGGCMWPSDLLAFTFHQRPILPVWSQAL